MWKRFVFTQWSKPFSHAWIRTWDHQLYFWIYLQLSVLLNLDFQPRILHYWKGVCSKGDQFRKRVGFWYYNRGYRSW